MNKKDMASLLVSLTNWLSPPVSQAVSHALTHSSAHSLTPHPPTHSLLTHPLLSAAKELLLVHPPWAPFCFCLRSSSRSWWWSWSWRWLCRRSYPLHPASRNERKEALNSLAPGHVFPDCLHAYLILSLCPCFYPSACLPVCLSFVCLYLWSCFLRIHTVV